MAHSKRKRTAYRIFAGAWVLALSWMFLHPALASAHAILLRSNPPIGAVLRNAPTQVQMWFSEDLNPIFTTAYVVNAEKSTTQSMEDKTTHTDRGDAHVVTNDRKEVDLSLKPGLPPAVYFVFYRTQSTIDGHILSDSFFFTIERPDGTVPTFNGSLPVPPLDGDTHIFTTPSLFDGPTFLSFLMITLVELGVVFWVGAQLWMTFVFELTDSEDQELRTLHRKAIQRFERLFSIPTLLLLLLANVGVLISQALVLTGGEWGQAFTPLLLLELVTNGQFGTFWIMRELVILLALVLAATLLLLKKPPRVVSLLLPWTNLVLGVALLIAVTLSGHAAAVDASVVVSSILIDGLHLLAAALWVGGMFYLATIYLPVLKDKTLQEQAAALLHTLPRYSPLAIIGVLIMAVSGPSNAAVHLPAWSQLLTTAYGRTLLLKISLVGGLLLTSALHVFWLRPHLKKTHTQYIHALEITQAMPEATSLRPQSISAQQVKALEGQVQQQTLGLTRILRWEPLLGIAVLLCTGLLSVFAGTLQSVVPSQETGASAQLLQGPVKPAVMKVQTTDKLFTATLIVSPNHQGPNTFTLHVLDKQSEPATAISISIFVTLPAMDMGTSVVNLQSDNKGNFSGTGNFTMPGNWRLSIEIRTPDNVLHKVQVRVKAP